MILLQDRDAVLGSEEERPFVDRALENAFQELGSMKFEGLAPS